MHLVSYVSFIRLSFRAHGRCYNSIKQRCPERFGGNTTLQKACAGYLSQARTNRNVTTSGQDISELKLFTSYLSCLERYRDKVDICISKLNDSCQVSSIRSTKTVRATMASVEYLIETVPHLKVIHLVR